MPDIKILFLHGLEGNPEGSKPTFLKQEGYRVIAPSLPKNDWELSVARAEDYFINFVSNWRRAKNPGCPGMGKV